MAPDPSDAGGLLTISLYASLLSLGVSLMVPMNTKNRPSANDRATMVIVLGEAIFCRVRSPGASQRIERGS